MNLKNIIGWTGVLITVLFTAFWSFWGIIENFHEGWYEKNIIENILMMFAQYLLFTIVFSALGVLSIKFKKTQKFSIQILDCMFFKVFFGFK